MTEPSDYERAAWPEATAQYVADLEAAMESMPKCWRLKLGIPVEFVEPTL